MDAIHGLRLALVALILERDGDNRHGKDAAVLCHLCDDRGCARARAAAHTGGNEEHLGAAVQNLCRYLVLAFQGGVTAGGGVSARAQSVVAHLDLHRDLAGL